MFTAVLAFILKNPLARKATVGAAILLVLFLGLKMMTHNAYETGKAEGVRQAYIKAEEAKKVEWSEQQAANNVREKQVQETINSLKQDRAALIARKEKADAKYSTKESSIPQQVSRPSSEPETQRDVLEGARNPSVTEDSGEKVESGQREYIEELRAYISADAQLDAEELAAANDKTAVVQAKLVEMTTERDFYKDAFDAGIRKPHHGFWHKVLRVVTLGVAK